MNLGSKPVIPEHLKVAKSKFIPSVPTVTGRPKVPFTQEDLDRLVELRAMGVSMVQCGILLRKSDTYCSYTVSNLQLKGAIRDKREELIKRVML